MSSKGNAPGRIGPWLARRGLPLCAAWGLAEATLFFFVPDVAITAVALYHPRRFLHAAAVAVVGAMVGGAMLFGITHVVGDPTLRVIDHVPAIHPSMFERARDQIDERGGMAVVRAPAEGIPYKIFAAEWALRDRPLWRLLIWTIPARALRFVMSGLLAALAGLVLRRLFQRHRDVWIIPHLAVWTSIYIAYFRSTGL